MSYGSRARVGGSNGKVDVESLERENDRGLDSLSEKVSLLKGATHAIKGEVDGQLGMLDNMEGSMLNVRGFLGSVNEKLGSVMADKQNKRTLLLACGAAVVLFVLWYLSK